MKTLVTLPQAALVLILSMSVSLIGCQKKRDPKLPDGEGRYAESVSKYDGKVFPLTTFGPLAKGGVYSSSEVYKVNVQTKEGNLVTFPAVDYKTEANLVNSIPILAKPNTSGVYEVHYKMTNTHLLVSKVAPEPYIPYHEKTYADKLSDGRLSVPLFGYPIVSKVARERVKNDYGESTTRLSDRPVMDISEAQFVVIDFTRFEEFGAIKKVDTFPVDFFTGENGRSEWYFAATVLSTPDQNSDLIGLHSAMSYNDSNSTENIVKFERTQNGLEVINLALDEKAKDNASNFKKILFIPGQYSEFKVEKDGRFRRMKEERESDDRISWKDTKYIKLDLDRINLPITLNNYMKQFSDGFSSGAKLVELNIESKSISIVLENSSSNLRVILSFLKKESSAYKPLVYHAEDHKLFGFFSVSKPHHLDYTIRRNEDYKKIFLVNRFDVSADKPIVFHLSKSTPDWLVPAAEDSVRYWNDAFQEAFNAKNSNAKFVVLNKTERVNTGDLRYNVLNFIDAKTTNMGLGGFGPTVTDPFTGQVISATSTLHVHTYRRILVTSIREYIMAQTGSYPQFYSNSGESLAGAVSTLQAAWKQKFGDQLKTTSWTEKVKYVADNRLQNNSFARDTAESQVLGVTDNIEQSIKYFCPEVISYIDTLKSSQSSYNEKEIETLEKCSEKILVKSIVATVVHEMGHNFGLRHNFAGSADYANIPKDANNKPLSTTSSIMDYVPTEYAFLLKPGPYDVAAIRYGYAHSVELKNQQFIKLNPQLSIRENLSGDLSKLRSYKFCSDEEAFLQNDPMCMRHDIGWTAEMAVHHAMKRANESFMRMTSRWDRAKNIDADTVATYFMTHAEPLLVHYSYWRNKLAEFMNKQDVYLTEVSTVEEYQKILEKMKADPVYGPIYKTYKMERSKGGSDLASQIFGFLFNYAFLPNHYCVLESVADKGLDLIEFDKLQSEVFSKTRTSVRSCLDTAATQYMQAKRNSKILTEFGYSTSNIRYDQNENSDYDTLHFISPYDKVSVEPVRQLSMALLNLRVVRSQRGADMGLFPSFMDEPDFRQIWLDQIFTRSIQGIVPGNLYRYPEVQQKLQQAGIADRFLKAAPFYRFTSEKNILHSGLILNYMGAQIPNNYQATIERMTPIGGTIIEDKMGVHNLLSGEFFQPGPKAFYAQSALESFIKVNVVLETTDEEMEQLTALVRALNLPKTQEEFNQLRIGDYLTNVNKMDEILKEYTGGNEEAVKNLVIKLNFFFPEIFIAIQNLNQVQPLSQKFVESQPEVQNIKTEEEAKALQENKALMEAIQKRFLSQSAKQLLAGYKPVNSEALIQAAKKRYQYFLNHKEEAKAQQDLLLKFMLRL